MGGLEREWKERSQKELGDEEKGFRFQPQKTKGLRQSPPEDENELDKKADR